MSLECTDAVERLDRVLTPIWRNSDSRMPFRRRRVKSDIGQAGLAKNFFVVVGG